MKRKLLEKKGNASIRRCARRAVSYLTVFALLVGTGQTTISSAESSEQNHTTGGYVCEQAESADHQHSDSCLQTGAQQSEEPKTVSETEKVTEAPQIETEKVTEKMTEPPQTETEKTTEKVTEAPRETEKVTEKVTEAQTESEPMTEKATETVVETEQMTEGITETELTTETDTETEVSTESETEQMTETESETETETEASRELVWEGEDYTLKVEYDSSANLPEDVTLEVTEIEQDSEEYQTYLEEAAEAVVADAQDQQIMFARFFDVQFTKDGEKLEPEAPVTVTITYAQTVEGADVGTCQTVHFADTGIEVLETSSQQLEDGSTSFTHQQDSFSVVGTVVTYADPGMAVSNEGGSRTITFMVRENGELIEVGKKDSYQSHDGHPYITSETAEKYFKEYGYDSNSVANSKIKYSYNDIYTIFYANGGAATAYCVDVSGNEINKEGTSIILYTSNKTDVQVFRIWEPESGYCYLTPVNSSSYHISLQNGATEDRTKLILSTEPGNASRWRKIENADGTVSFETKLRSGSYLDLPNGTTTDSTQLQIWNNGECRYWKLEQKYRFSDAVSNGNTISSTLKNNGDIVCVYDIPDTSTMIYTPAGLKKLANGGTYKLGHDITLTSIAGDAAAELTGDVSTTLDLNGHTILYDPASDEGDKLIFKLSGTSSLTLQDSGKAIENVETVSGDLCGNLCGNLASYDKDTETLTYYVTESAASGTGTTETLKKYTVDLRRVGALESHSASMGRLILAEGSASLHIAGGRYTNSKGYRAITANTDGNVTISGGYICGNTAYGASWSIGGGIYVNGSGDLTISGGVIAANKASKAGGVYKGGSGTFTMTGGVVSGNQIPSDAKNGDSTTDCRGGGIQSDVDTVISGGYITNNRDEFYCGKIGYGDHFGGGIACWNGTMTVSGGYITGNYSEEAGGGIGFSGKKFTMTGGIVAANTAQLAEGGGIRIQSATETSLITGGYITNNSTNTTHDWGGGGIFLTQGNSLQIMNAVFTRNDADGFGGGIGGCSTGQIIAVDNSHGGIAVYDNQADGEVMAGSDGVASSKPDDLTAKNNQTFMMSGYQDLFCALNSAVAGSMLGGGDQNWTGSCDYQQVNIRKEDMKIASQMMGLTANPSQNDITTALGLAGVYISGNHSGTHGGGIMSNGTLILGEASEVDLTPGLKISGSKLFKNITNGEELGTAQGQFTFQLLDYEKKVLKTVTNAADGTFYIEPDIPKEEGTHTYYLKELSRGTAGMTYDISYDLTVYKLEVTVAKRVTVRNLSQGKTFTTNHYVVTGITASIEGSDQMSYVKTNEYLGSKDHRAEVTIRRSENADTFVNTIREKPLYFRISKVDSSTQKPMSFVEFTLKDSNEQQISESTKSDGIAVFTIKKGETYTLTEKTPDGYYKAGPWILEVDNDGKVTIWKTTTNANGTLEKDGEGISCEGKSIDGVIYYDYTIENTRGYSLPNTGGTGTLPFTAGGTALVTAALLGYLSLCRKKKYLSN